MRLPKRSVLLMLLASAAVAVAQMPTYHLGRTPTQEEISALDQVVGPEGKELPAGKGSAIEGAALYAKKCAACHGRGGEGSKLAPRLIKLDPMYPFATTLWSFINTAMPRKVSDLGDRDGTLPPDEVYAITAFLLYKNGVIKESEVLDAKSLPRVRVPGRDPRLNGLVPH
jgi:S-disulfanyl-L-cysteine oxidoreductase SoxD